MQPAVRGKFQQLRGRQRHRGAVEEIVAELTHLALHFAQLCDGTRIAGHRAAHRFPFGSTEGTGTGKIVIDQEPSVATMR